MQGDCRNKKDDKMSKSYLSAHGKTPEEIKHAVAVHGTVMRECGKQGCAYFSGTGKWGCIYPMLGDAYRYIDWLEKRVAELESTLVHTTGQWIGERGEYICNNCGEEAPSDGYYPAPYCFGCGAKMSGMRQMNRRMAGERLRIQRTSSRES